MLIAITREVSPGFENCELTHLERTVIDLDLASLQHGVYEDCLAVLGCQILRLPAGSDLPDSVFVEDIALVLEEAAVITRPGAASRQQEVPAVAEALAGYRRLLSIEPPGTLDGGDVLRLGRQLFVGRSERTNEEGVAQLRRLVEPFGYSVTGVPVRGCLHLKSAVTQVASTALLINPEWVDAARFPGWQAIEIDPAEPFAANALLIGDSLVYPAAYPLTRARLERAGIRVVTVDVSEIAKAEGGVTCCSLVFDVRI
jgi:dimethylargininase